MLRAGEGRGTLPGLAVGSTMAAAAWDDKGRWAP